MTFDGVRRVFADSHAPALHFTAILILWAGALAGPGLAIAAETENADIAHRRATERRNCADAEIIDGFFKVTFGAEFHIAGGVDRIRKYDGPVKVFIDNRATPDRTSQVATAIADIRSRIRNLDITMTERHDDAIVLRTTRREYCSAPFPLKDP